MSETNQPVWKLVGHVGDVDPIAHGGGFIYEDETGRYAPEMTLFVPGSDEEWKDKAGATPCQVFRILLERESAKEWWFEDLTKIAQYIGATLEEVLALANGNSQQKGLLYQVLIQYHGAENFDESPQTLTEDEAYAKFKLEMSYAHAYPNQL